MGVKIGIDLGTTYSAVARINPETGKPEVVCNSFGDRTTPSALCFQDDGEVLFGEEAKQEFAAGSPLAVAFWKRDMGNKSYQRTILGENYSPTELSATYLRLLVADAEKVMGERVDGAVITVPAYFAHAQVRATMDAAAAAGINLISTVHEPTAAALAYGLDKADAVRTVLFYDLGGGTFDVTLARVSPGDLTVLGSDGDHRLGGKDWDDVLARHILGLFLDEHGLDVTGDPRAVTAIQGKSEQIKRQLSAKQSVSVPLVVAGQRVSVSVTQDEFAEIADQLCARTLDIITALLDQVQLTWADIDLVIPVGGSTKMPMIKSFLARQTTTPIETGVSVDEAVALGAAIKANALGLGEHQDLTIGGAPAGGPRGGSGPLTLGFRLTEVVAHALGMIAVNQAGDAYVNSEIIKKNSQIPASSTRVHMFKASKRNREMEIYVLQGDFPHPLDNAVVNKYVATDIREIRRDGERIDVTYSYDADGLVVVSAKQEGRPLPVRIEKVPEDMSWAGRPPQAPMQATITLAIDLSGSMSGHPLDQAKLAMRESFLDNLPDSDLEVGVLLFADNTSWLSRPTRNHDKLSKKIKGITIGQDGVGYGNGTDPFVATDKLSEGDYLIVLTDGMWSNQPLAVERARRLHQAGVNVIALGFGGANLAFLKQIATTEDLAGLTDLSRLGDSFGRIAQVVSTGAASIGLR